MSLRDNEILIRVSTQKLLESKDEFSEVVDFQRLRIRRHYRGFRERDEKKEKS